MLNDKRVPTTGMIDTGAEVSAIPVEIDDKLELPYTSNNVVTQQNGVPHLRKYCRAHIEINGYLYPIHSPVVGEKTMIGRDILNTWKLVLDGIQKRGHYSIGGSDTNLGMESSG